MSIAATAKTFGVLAGKRGALKLHRAWSVLCPTQGFRSVDAAAAAVVGSCAPSNVQSSSCRSALEKSSSSGSCKSSSCYGEGAEQRGGSALLLAATGLSLCILGWSSSSRSSSKGSRSSIAHCLSPASSGASQVYVWGSNIDGQVGMGSALSVSFPVLLSSLPLRPEETVVALSGGPRHSACITSEGRVFSWGRGAAGDCGGLAAADGPREIVLPLQQGDRPVSVSCGNGFSLVVTELGHLYTWGSNSHGQCGRTSQEAAAEQQQGRPGAPPYRLEGLGSRDVFGGRSRGPPCLPPGQVEGPLAAEKVVGAACGDRVCAAVTAAGEVFVWGEARTGGALGGRAGEGQRPSHEPRRVALPAEAGSPARATAVACGESHCVALSEGGLVYSWGSNCYGQLGLGGAPRTVEAPQLVTALRDQRVVAVACGAQHSLCLTQDGRVFVWGYGKDGQCADSTHLDIPLPRKVDFAASPESPPVGPCTRISGGEGHSLAVCGGGRLFVWGRGREGQLGRGGLLESPAASRDVPVEVFVAEGQKVALASCGGCHTIAATRPDKA
ncbi:regulator of chromosome condensation domain-containing protein, putative [Eimeria tenella]|uniref:Regulator of chromosome condensation domain-containing protein, putative n=1 Tax=Eimeria tenella TaxID=5802 RepID=U6KH01_EIMTE|nr:regulator of chromosome condensation domain-containing protein, putative [Eimeria tenella]CDJ37229.1 regulator of chromosome condensation domain-containing protein, putative [Eimeria tenella]|eukprot:XP_013228067.1 regulator of chromosome condensation domain-containing protein, putative [Eimeria tenella]